eukprot:scaffold24516_cov60-Phaeocystis_antarctica.AAC.1
MSSLLALDRAFALCRVERRAYCTVRGIRCGPRGGGAGCGGLDGGARSVQVRARLRKLGAGTREAHLKHVSHGCDAGRVEAQRLVERRRNLPRVERRARTMRSEVLNGTREGVVRRQRTRGMRC